MGSDTGVSGGVVTILKSGKRQMSHTSDGMPVPRKEDPI